MNKKITPEMKSFIEDLRAIEIYNQLRNKGFMTSRQTVEACEVVEDAINELIKKHFGDRV